MFAFILGLLAGAAQFVLLKKTTALLLSGKPAKALPLVAAKIAVFVCLFAVVIIFFRQHIAYAGIGVAVPIIAGSVLNFVKTSFTKGGARVE